MGRGGSKIAMTINRYTHTLLSDEANALNVLPQFPGDDSRAQTMKATGTDDADPASKSVLPSCLPEREPIGHKPVRLRAMNASGKSADASDGPTKPKTQEHAGKSVSETNSDDGHEPSEESMRDRTRTCNLRFRRTGLTTPPKA